MSADVPRTAEIIHGEPGTSSSGLNIALPEWRPRPFLQFVVKIVARCNLSCDYCYVYTKADQRWRLRPHTMSNKTVDHTAARVAEHVRDHSLDGVEIILHGGEPLMVGPERMRHMISRFRGQLTGDSVIHFALQTNGVLLDERFLGLFDETDVRIGISLDGFAQGHDLHRRFANGRGSHRAVQRALARLGAPGYRRLFSGLLCTIDLRNDPLRTYQALLEYEPPTVDFLLPHGTWAEPPPARTPGDTRTLYADWLIAIFDQWYHTPVRPTRIRIFEEIINVLLGGDSAVEGVGLSPSRFVVIQTDGQIEQADVLATAYEGAALTGLHVSRDHFDAALRHPMTLARQTGAAALAHTCQSCPIRDVCGGGLYTHRYSATNGFDNPSVYCPDLYRLIEHIRATLVADLAKLAPLSALRGGG